MARRSAAGERERDNGTQSDHLTDIGFRRVCAVAVAALAILIAGGCTHAVKIDSPAESIAVDITVHIQQQVVLTAAR